jgi:hypothetical protein
MRNFRRLSVRGAGARLAEDGYSVYRPSTSMALLYLVAGVATAICWIATARSTDQLSPKIAWTLTIAAPAALAFAGAARVFIGEFVNSLGPREKALLLLAHIIFFFAPLFDPKGDRLFTGYFIYCLLAVQIPLIALLHARQGFVRLFSFQLGAMLLASITDPRDDTTSLALNGAFVGCLVVAGYLSRAAFTAEAYGAAAPMSLRRVGRATGLALLLVAAVSIGARFAMPGRDYNARPTLGIGSSSLVAPSGGAGPSSVGSNFNHLLKNAAILAVAIAALIWTIEKMRRLLTRRKKGLEIDLDLRMGEMASEPEAVAARRSQRTMEEPRRRVVDAFWGFLAKYGPRLSNRTPAQTARDFAEGVARRPGWEAEGERMAPIGRAFESARYDREPVTMAEAERFEGELAALRDAVEARLGDAEREGGKRAGD